MGLMAMTMGRMMRMKDLNEIIKALQIHTTMGSCKECPYESANRMHCVDKMMEDALEKLKRWEDDLK